MLDIAIISTHPIQYNAPLFRYLAGTGDCRIKVFYTWGQAQGKVLDKDFGIEREWDIDLLSGYDHVFVKNTSTAPGSHHYKGIINPSLISEVTAFQPDKIIVYGWKFDSHLKLLRHFKGKIPLYFRGDSTLLDEPAGFNIKKAMRRVLLQWVYRHVDFVLSPGTASDAYFLNAGLSANQIIRAPHSVDNARFSGTEIPDEHSSYDESAQHWRKELSIPEDAKVFLFAGKLEPKKDPILLVKAFARLHQQYPNTHLIMVGNGVLEEELKKMTSPPQPSDGKFNPSTPLPTAGKFNSSTALSPITFLPFQNQSIMPVVYRLGDIVVLPSKGPGETWGLAINEAMACGKPVIASDKSGAAADMIKDNENGFVFKAGDEIELYNCMEKMVIADTSTMGAKAFEKVQHFSYASFGKAMGNVESSGLVKIKHNRN
jgi:glycosyltransferase involved in cell wall biosynthesis